MNLKVVYNNNLNHTKKQYQQQDELALNLMDQMKTNLIQLDRFFNNLMSEKNIAINRAYLDQIKDFRRPKAPG